MSTAREKEYYKKTGERIPVLVGGARNDEDGSVIAFVLDLTERKAGEQALRAADDLRASRAAAESANEAKSAFLSSMSHELRTPLNAILGFAQLMHRDRKEVLSSRHLNRVEQILRGGDHLLHLIDDILDLSRIESGKVAVAMEPVDVREILERVRDMLEPMAKKASIGVMVGHIATDIPTVAADATRFTQILMNFGSNAIKYNHPRGSVFVSAECGSTGTVRITVKDTGLGIPAEHQPHLFEPFQRCGHEAGPITGTGLGLVITKRLAELMNGMVGFRSLSGEGSEFWLELAVHGGAARPSSPPAFLRTERPGA